MAKKNSRKQNNEVLMNDPQTQAAQDQSSASIDQTVQTAVQNDATATSQAEQSSSATAQATDASASTQSAAVDAAASSGDTSAVSGTAVPVPDSVKPAPVPPVPTPAPAPVVPSAVTVKLTPAPAPAAPTPAPAQAIAPSAVGLTDPIAILENVLEGVSVSTKLSLQTMIDYILKMAPKKPIAVSDGVRQQVALYRAITNLINNAGEDFNKAFGAVLRAVHEGRNGVFHEIHLFRFMEHIDLPQQDRQAFARLLNLIKLTADPKARQIALKQVDLTGTLSHGISEAGRQRTFSFFGK